MSAVSIEKINEVIRGGINRFLKPYSTTPDHIQIIFSLKPEGGVKFITCVDEKQTHTVELKHLMGKNPYNFLVRKHIEGLLFRFSEMEEVPTRAINLMAGVRNSGEGSEVYFLIRKNSQLIREITDPDELK